MPNPNAMNAPAHPIESLWARPPWSEALTPLQYTLRPAQPSDEPFLEELAMERLAPDLMGGGLPPDLLREILIMQARAQAMSYARAYPDAFHGILVDSHGRSSGRLIVAAASDCLVLADIALRSFARGRGLGTALLQAFKAEAALAGLPARLSVVRTSPALRLYSRLGFRVTGGDAVRQEMEWRPETTAAP